MADAAPLTMGPQDPGPAAKMFGGGLGILPSPMFFQGSANPAPVTPVPADPNTSPRGMGLPVPVGPATPAPPPPSVMDQLGGFGGLLGAVRDHLVGPVAEDLNSKATQNFAQGNIGAGIGNVIGAGLGGAAHAVATPFVDTAMGMGALGMGVGHFARNVYSGLMGADPTDLAAAAAPAPATAPAPAQVAAQPAAAPVAPAVAALPKLPEGGFWRDTPDGGHAAIVPYSIPGPNGTTMTGMRLGAEIPGPAPAPTTTTFKAEPLVGGPGSGPRVDRLGRAQNMIEQQLGAPPGTVNHLIAVAPPNQKVALMSQFATMQSTMEQAEQRRAFNAQLDASFNETKPKRAGESDAEYYLRRGQELERYQKAKGAAAYPAAAAALTYGGALAAEPH